MRSKGPKLRAGSMCLAVAMSSGCGSIERWNNIIQGSGTVGRHEESPGPGVDDHDPDALPSADIRGSIRDSSGSQAQMAGWVVALTDAQRQSARVGEIDNAGLFELMRVHAERQSTLTLLTPDYIVASVTSIPPTDPSLAVIRQYVRPQATTLPGLIHSGPVIRFGSFEGLEILRLLASDANKDGIPDGMRVAASFRGGSSLCMVTCIEGPTVDTDLDGIPNIFDPDIDGDGVANVFDADDDGDAVLDVFDGDANADLENDASPGQDDADFNFDEGVELVSVQVELAPRPDGEGTETSMTFVAKIRDGINPLAVQIRGAPSLLNGANFVARDEAGNETLVAWNRLLADDGTSGDWTPGDRIYGRRVVLDRDKLPRASEVVFFQLAFGSLESPWYMEFPYTFSSVRPEAISAQYDPEGRIVLFIGNPFGSDIQDFVWTIEVSDEGGRTIWTSEAVPGATRQHEIPESVLVPGAAHSMRVVAQTLDKVPGLPAYVVKSSWYRLDP